VCGADIGYTRVNECVCGAELFHSPLLSIRYTRVNKCVCGADMGSIRVNECKRCRSVLLTAYGIHKGE